MDFRMSANAGRFSARLHRNDASASPHGTLPRPAAAGPAVASTPVPGPLRRRPVS